MTPFEDLRKNLSVQVLQLEQLEQIIRALQSDAAAIYKYVKRRDVIVHEIATAPQSVDVSSLPNFRRDSMTSRFLDFRTKQSITMICRFLWNTQGMWCESKSAQP